MNQQDIYKNIEKLIVKGDLSEAFLFLRKHQPSDAINILEAEYNELINNERKGTLLLNQLQIRKNQIHDKILSLAKDGPIAEIKNKKGNSLIKILIPVFLLLGIIGIWWGSQKEEISCPIYPPDLTNKILILPFQNIGGEETLPHKVFEDKINKFARRKRLNILAKSSESNMDLTFDVAPELAQKCQADLIVWGNYSNTDSLHLNIKYYFANPPTIASLDDEEFSSLKNVASVYKGEMSKNMLDAVRSLCGVIVVRDGDNIPLAKSWFEKIDHKENMDKEILKAFK